MTLMETNELSKSFGGLKAVSKLNLQVDEGEIVGIIGPNGSGKSTVLNMIGGTHLPTSGRVFFQGKDVTRLKPHQKAASGIARVFQENVLFGNFSVLDNLMVGLYQYANPNMVGLSWPNVGHSRREPTMAAQGLEILEELGLATVKDQTASSLPHGKQRILSLAAALATEPKLLLLDEPITGMNAEEIEFMVNLIKNLRDERGITCVVIEHNLRAVMELCDRINVLNFGNKIAEGAPTEIVANSEVIKAYIGEDEDTDP